MYVLTLHQAACGRISLTADVWTDKPQRRSYLCITAHWIGRDPQTKTLTLRSEILAFHHLSYESHHGAGLAAVVIQMLDRAEITAKVREQGILPVPSLTLSLGWTSDPRQCVSQRENDGGA